VAWLSGWGYRRPFTIQYANVDSTLADFPIRVPLDNDSDLSKALATGYDVRFTQSDGETLLSYEQDNWSGGGGSNVTADFWVKIPSISAVAGTDNYLYYNKAGASDGQDVTNVWDSNFKCVLHLGEASGILYDSTSNNNDFTAINTPTFGQTGKVGQCMLFNNAQEELIRRSSAAVTGPPFTFSAWYKTDNLTDSMQTLVGMSHSAHYSRYDLTIRGNTDKICHSASYGGAVSVEATAVSTANVWEQATCVAASTSSRTAYLNGGNKGTDTTTKSINTSYFNQMAVGAHWRSVSTYLWEMSGYIDEVRISDTARSDAWIKFEYANINEADNEITWGAEEAAPSESSVNIALFTKRRKSIYRR